MACDEAERAKYMASFKREEVKIQTWENHQIRKAEMEMKKMEVGEFFSSAKSNIVAQQRKLEVQITAESSIDSSLLLEQEETSTKQIKLGFISGVVSREKSVPFKRILFRATRGNMFLKQGCG